MPSLKDFRDRITSVKSTKKITSAMKMVAASKLKRAQGHAESAQPYAQAMAGILARVAAGITVSPTLPKLLIGTGAEQKQLLVVISSDRGLCGGFNGNLIRYVRNHVRTLEGEGHDVSIITVGRKARDVLKRDMGERIIASYTDLGTKGRVGYDDSDQVVQDILTRFDNGEFDVCSLVYNEFKNVLVQKPSTRQLVPFKLTQSEETEALDSPYEFEPEEEVILGQLLPKNIGMQVFSAMLDSAAGEQAARMTAMDNATRNAGDMINKLTLQYNRARQAYITKELIEIISGAEAV